MRGEDYEQGYVQALRDLVAHCSYTVANAALPPEGKDQHVELIGFMQGLIATKEARLAKDGTLDGGG